MVLPIRLVPDPILREVCAPVDRGADVSGLARDMLATMYAAPGRGLAAPQIGEGLRLFVMDCSWKEGLPDPRVFVNPVIIDRSGSQTNEEGCLSLPDVPRLVARADRVTLAFDGPRGQRTEVFEGLAAACVQHEVDHLDGVLITDHPEAPLGP
ncbi:peptide deformylase [Jannaschia sp. 2305UL9-9]|uniref:peptide deformylase n=1 Tax=Jannaschia sp. 2305UL9-9 TaxID=3121638 RepID=UPI0035298BE4